MKYINYLTLNQWTNIKELGIKYNKNIPIRLRNKPDSEFALISLKKGYITNIYDSSKQMVRAALCLDRKNGFKSIVCKIIIDQDSYFLEKVDGRTFK